MVRVVNSQSLAPRPPLTGQLSAVSESTLCWTLTAYLYTSRCVCTMLQVSAFVRAALTFHSNVVKCRLSTFQGQRVGEEEWRRERERGRVEEREGDGERAGVDAHKKGQEREMRKVRDRDEKGERER